MKKILSFLLIYFNVTLVSAQLTVLHSFTGQPDGNGPNGDLYYDGTYLYGTTVYGGTGTCTYGCGIIFRIKPDGTGYLKLLDFIGTNGVWPYGSFISDGTYLYAMARDGSTNQTGNVFKIKKDGTGFTT